MDRPAQLHFALDVDDLASAGPHLAGDARRPAECEAADFQDAQPVDLPDAQALGGDQRDLFDDGLFDAVAQSRRAAYSRVERVVDVQARDGRPFRLARIEIGLGERVIELVEGQRQLARMRSHPGDMFDDPRHRRAIQCEQAFALHGRGDQASEQGLVVGRTRQVVLEVGEKLEMFAQLGIERAKP